MDKVFVNLVFGVILLMSSNILMGSADALLNGQFDWNKFFKGLGKAGVISVGMIMTLYAGVLNPDIMSFEVGEEVVNIVTGIRLVLIASFIWYGSQNISKIKNFIVPTKK